MVATVQSASHEPDAVRITFWPRRPQDSPGDWVAADCAIGDPDIGATLTIANQDIDCLVAQAEKFVRAAIDGGVIVSAIQAVGEKGLEDRWHLAVSLRYPNGGHGSITDADWDEVAAITGETSPTSHVARWFSAYAGETA
jgi:hypothetical protein